MKSLLLSIIILSLGQVNAQCVKLYVKEHLSGSPICQLSEGDYIEICEDDNEVNGCPYNFYVYDKGSSYGSLTYELSLDRGWSTHYMTLMVNPKTKRFVFILQGQTAMYSYYTESDLATARAKEAEIQRIINEQKLELDKKLYEKINLSILREDFLSAETEFTKLNFPQNYPKNQEYRSLERKYLLKNDAQNYSKIKSLIDNYKLKDAQSEIKRLNFPNEFPYMEELNVKFDDQIVKEIHSILSDNNFSDATRLYELLKLPNNQTQQKNLIQSKLESFYGDKVDSISQSVYTKYINENSSSFKGLKPGKHTLKIDRAGNVLLADKVIGISKDITERKYGSFSVKTISEVTLNVSETYTPQGAQLFLASTKKRIYSKLNGKKYKAVFMGGPGYFGDIGFDIHELVQVTFDRDIPKNQLRTVQPSLKKLIINNKIEIPQNIENVSIKEEKIKTRWLAIGTRSLALLSGLSWSALRIYEFTLIP